ncbi:DMT family transporter [Virgibacillus sp. YIM 98842]|uniref:DMT family transporter n=1 Tax=Virgibacillus sp. YIM 98842 TaxID=2663533 RepID=UPI001F093819|nr:DMT family transporter [Virgibacillus sp. YIM 98842]
MDKNTRYIYLIVIFVMLMWGMNVSALKVIVENFMPITITSLRILVAGLVVFIILAFAGGVRLPKKKEWYFIAGGSVFSVVLHHYFLASGLTMTSAANTGLILGMGPVLTVIFATVILKRKPSKLQFTGFIFGFIGVSFTVLAGSEGIDTINLGDLYILLSILSQALSFIVIKKAAESMDPRLFTGYMLIFGSVFLFVISLWSEPNGIASLSNVDYTVWLVFLFSAVIATGVGHMAYNYAISQLGPAETSIFLNLNTFFSIIGAAIFLNEVILFSHFIGLIFIVSGVIFGSGGLEAWLIGRRKKRM